MTSVFTTCRLSTPTGQLLTEIADYEVLDYVLNSSPGGIGNLELQIKPAFNPSFLMEDGWLAPYRSVDGGPAFPDNDAVFLIRYIDFGPSNILVRAQHATNLLDRRVIAYDAGTTYTSKGPDFADDLIKEYVNQNMLSGIVSADRDGVETYADVSAYLVNQADRGLGATLSISAARRRLLDVAVALANASATAGTYLTFDITSPVPGLLELRTYTTVRGQDRRASTSNPAILSRSRGNIENDHLIIDYTQSATFIVAGGQGQEDLRTIGTAFDATRAGATPFGRIERFRDAPNVSAQASVDDVADATLRESRPLIYVTGDLVETPAFVRGKDFDLGDLMTVENAQTGLQYDVRLDIVRERTDRQGRKTTAGLRSMT